MNPYEFWNDLDKIFDAVVAFQEKNIEFNKQFINPWIKLGNELDRQEINEAIIALKNATEIDPTNTQNWFELANTYIRAGKFDKSIQAYQKSLELGQESAELYKNLALAYVAIGKYQDSTVFFQKGLSLANDNTDKAALWNHLGNAYRKLNNYEMAIEAFQKADSLDTKRSTGQEKLSATTLDEALPDRQSDGGAVPTERADASHPTGKFASVMDNLTAYKAIQAAIEDEISPDKTNLERKHDEASPKIGSNKFAVAENGRSATEELEIDVEAMESNLETSENDYEDEIDFLEQEEATEELEKNRDEFDEEELSVKFLAAMQQADNATLESLQAFENEAKFGVRDTTEIHPSASDDREEPLSETMRDSSPLFEAESEGEGEKDIVHSIVTFADEGSEGEGIEENTNTRESDTNLVDDRISSYSAYEEYLKDNIGLVGVSSTEGEGEGETEEAQSISIQSAQVDVTHAEVNMDTDTNLYLDMDTKNAQVWNELGNVYFNAGSFDDAIAAYSKAIEMDSQFAWPYTNLALTYVQKERLSEAILLYQRSIELFTNDNDKAITWNRLGDVYRRMSDYENAIASYQRADDLDPGNNAITNQTRFSLLGSETSSQEVEYSLQPLGG